MSDAQLPADDRDPSLGLDDALPPEHPAGSDSPVSAGEILSDHAAAAPSAATFPTDPPGDGNVPGDDS
jgi:hypothetical protein